MDTLIEIRNFLLILIPVGVTVRVVASLIYMTISEDPTPFKRKIKNALIFFVIAESIVALLGASGTLAKYFGGILWP